jgi:hypothetical protein
MEQPPNSQPVLIRISTSIPGRLSQLSNKICGLREGALPIVHFFIAVFSHHEHLPRKVTFSAKAIIIADKSAFFVAKFIRNLPLIILPRTVSHSIQAVELLGSRLY